MVSRVDPEAARKVFLAAGLEPLEEFPGSRRAGFRAVKPAIARFSPISIRSSEAPNAAIALGTRLRDASRRGGFDELGPKLKVPVHPEA